jgi:5-methyltetrahydrofolate corrinoid/iron sulfur protein methyltransferase
MRRSVLPDRSGLRARPIFKTVIAGRDYVMTKPFIVIGESVHASIRRTKQVMEQLHESGPDAYERPSRQLDYIKDLIRSQAAEGASYIGLNVDAFGEDRPQTTVDIMLEYVTLVRKWGGGVAVCIDSSDQNVLIAGRKKWYSSDERVNKPLVNSIKPDTMQQMMELKKDYDYAFIGMLMSEQNAAGQMGSGSVDRLYSLARQMFEQAVSFGFEAGEIFFDPAAFPLAIDMPMEPNVPGYTYLTFETIKKIKSDAKMKGVHCSLGISNCVRDLPARKIGICRAYVAKAMEYGLDAGIVNPVHHLHEGEADPKLLELVDAYAEMDGSADAMNRAMRLMGEFCQAARESKA